VSPSGGSGGSRDDSLAVVVTTPSRSLGGPGFELVERTRKTIDRYEMLTEGDSVLVALSGGPDSTCLLDVLRRLSGPLALDLEVAHVDHGLSEDSERVGAEVSSRAAEEGFEVHMMRAPDLGGPNLHARARAFRYSFLTTIAEQMRRAAGSAGPEDQTGTGSAGPEDQTGTGSAGPEDQTGTGSAGPEDQTGAGSSRTYTGSAQPTVKIATGHTLDDRVETTLARLVHGAGTEGLAGIPPNDAVRSGAVGGVARIRPLIESRRSQTRAYCDELGLTYFEDPANDDDRFERPAVRHEVLSAIERRWGDGAVRAMAVSADRLQDDARALNALAAALYGRLARSSEDGTRLATESLAAAPRALRRRVLGLAVGRVRDRAGGVEAVVRALDSPADGRERTFAVASGIEIVLARDDVTVRPKDADTTK
jgi:tRNA(Ile)-lysidine synthase TilS/MesJ